VRVPSITGGWLAAAAGSFGCVRLSKGGAFWLRAEAGGSVRSCALPIAFGHASNDRCRRQRRRWSSANRELGRVPVLSESEPAQASVGRRKVVGRRQLYTRGCGDNGGFRAARVARGTRCGVSW
jgi:hypothetical protein